ncbi:hypothetical protein EYD10_01049 [Varanus komodoensis]|nr:hypothetical protein EYD10_01049 [Varanus komodoensis]
MQTREHVSTNDHVANFLPGTVTHREGQEEPLIHYCEPRGSTCMGKDYLSLKGSVGALSKMYLKEFTVLFKSLNIQLECFILNPKILSCEGSKPEFSFKFQASSKKGVSRLDKQMRKFTDIRKKSRTSHAVKISIEGNKMPFTAFPPADNPQEIPSALIRYCKRTPTVPLTRILSLLCIACTEHVAIHMTFWCKAEFRHYALTKNDSSQDGDLFGTKDYVGALSGYGLDLHYVHLTGLTELASSFMKMLNKGSRDHALSDSALPRQLDESSGSNWTHSLDPLFRSVEPHLKHPFGCLRLNVPDKSQCYQVQCSECGSRRLLRLGQNRVMANLSPIDFNWSALNSESKNGPDNKVLKEDKTEAREQGNLGVNIYNRVLCKGEDPIVLVCHQSRMDPDGFLEALGDFPVGKAGAPVDALVELWNEEMTRAIDTIAPKRPLPPGRAHSSPWYMLELRAMKQVGRCLERRWKRSWGASDRTHLRAHYRAYAVAEKITQIRLEIDSAIGSDSTGKTPSTPLSPQLMDEFQLLKPDDVDKVLGQVRPTTCLQDPCPSWLLKKAKDRIVTWILEVANASLRDGRVPAPLKEAVVRPVLKKASLDPEVATNYRPVANIPFLGKVLERVVVGQLQTLLDETDYLDPFQSGFRPGYGTESALVALYDDLCREKDRGSASLLVLLDLSAAFDTIDHGILLDRLAGLGVGGTAWQWFRSYLNGQFQKVVLGDYGSAPWQLCHGVPQGSILSPLLFNIYMKPLGEVIRRCGLRNHQYTDDTQLYLSFSTNRGEAVAVLNRCLAEVMGWMRANKLKLNPDKTEVLLVGRSDLRMGDLGLVLNGVAL